MTDGKTGLPLMSVIGLILCGVLVLPPQAAQAAPAPPSHPTPADRTSAFENGRWFDGQTFSAATWYSVQGVLTSAKPATVDSTFDLQGRYVVPPFGEAHTHNVEGEWNIDQVIHQYLRDGVFYVRNTNNIAEFAEHIRHKINRPDSIDVTFAHGGLTSPEGHPVRLYEDRLRMSRYEPVIGKRAKGWFQGRAYFLISTLQDLTHQWPLLLAANPDFLKIYLAGSEGFGEPDHPVHHTFHQGLNPELIAPIVAFAHQQGLRVLAHVETAADFRTALQGGADEIAHVPGWFVPDPSQHHAVRLTPDDARLAATRQAVVTTTTVAGRFHPPGHLHHSSHDPLRTGTSRHPHVSPSEAQHHTAKDIQVHNLTLLHQAGVTIAIGSDHAETALAEALYLHQLGVFDNLTLLKMWCETTPQTIFPSRNIGRFQEGSEASFLVLQGNPLTDFRQVEQITLRVKQGIPLLLDHANPQRNRQ